MSSLRDIISSHPVVFLGKGVLKIYSKFIGEHPCRSMISHFKYDITLRHGCSPINLLQIACRTPFPKNTSGRLLLWHADGHVYFPWYSSFISLFRQHVTARSKLENLSNYFKVFSIWFFNFDNRKWIINLNTEQENSVSIYHYL